MKKFITLALALFILSLSGCGTSTPSASGGGSSLPGYYVNAATGNDANAGTQAAPFKTITKALATASTGTTTNIYVAPGTYDAANGEVFPLKVASSGINLIGDIANKGVGAASTTITGSGNMYTITGGSRVGTPETASIVFVPGVSASISGFYLLDSNDNILVDNASATISNNTTLGASAGSCWSIFIVNNSVVTLTSNVINGVNAIDAEDALTKVIARNNIINQNYPVANYGITTGAWTGPASDLDLGTAASPGNNIILGGQLGLMSTGNPAVLIKAVGNTWKPNVQGADAAGHYLTPFVASGTAGIVAGDNYATADTTVGIQF